MHGEAALVILMAVIMTIASTGSIVLVIISKKVDRDEWGRQVSDRILHYEALVGAMEAVRNGGAPSGHLADWLSRTVGCDVTEEMATKAMSSSSSYRILREFARLEVAEEVSLTQQGLTTIMDAMKPSAS